MKSIFADPLQMSHACHFFLTCYGTLTFCAKPHLNLQKWSEDVVFLCVFNILTWKCASRHNDVHFFNISTAKSVPRLRCFVHFDFGMCFVPQRRALFNISTSKSVPNPSVFNTFDFETCFAPQRRAIFHLSFGQMAPHAPL